MVQPLVFIMWLAADVDAQTAQQTFVLITENDGEVGICALQVGKLFLGLLRYGVGQSGDGQSHEYLVRVKPGIFVQQISGFQIADGLQNLGGD